jgi:hypothetical protein
MLVKPRALLQHSHPVCSNKIMVMANINMDSSQEVLRTSDTKIWDTEQETWATRSQGTLMAIKYLDNKKSTNHKPT